MKLTVKSKYTSQKAQYEAGAEIEVPPAEAEFLMKDAPGCFELAEVPAEVEKEFSAPVDKQQRKSHTK